MFAFMEHSGANGTFAVQFAKKYGAVVPVEFVVHHI